MHCKLSPARPPYPSSKDKGITKGQSATHHRGIFLPSLSKPQPNTSSIVHKAAWEFIGPTVVAQMRQIHQNSKVEEGVNIWLLPTAKISRI